MYMYVVATPSLTSVCADHVCDVLKRSTCVKVSEREKRERWRYGEPERDRAE